MLSTNVQPPPAMGTWTGGYLTLNARLVSPHRIPITGSQTCVSYDVTVNRRATVQGYGSLSSNGMFKRGTAPPPPGGATHQPAYTLSPGSTLHARTCFNWNGHASNPLAEFPNFTKPAERQAAIHAVDKTHSIDVPVYLTFHIVPTNSNPTDSTHWTLVYQNTQAH